MSSNYPPGVTGFEPEIAGWDDDMPSERQLQNWNEANDYTAEGLEDADPGPVPDQYPARVSVELPGHIVRAVASWAEWGGSTAERAIENLCRSFLASQERLLGNEDLAQEWLGHDDQAEAERKQRANAAAVADGFAPPYPEEY